MDLDILEPFRSCCELRIKDFFDLVLFKLPFISAKHLALHGCRSAYSNLEEAQKASIPIMQGPDDDIGKGNKNVFSNHQIALTSIFKKSRQMATRFLKNSSNGDKIFLTTR